MRSTIHSVSDWWRQWEISRNAFWRFYFYIFRLPHDYIKLWWWQCALTHDTAYTSVCVCMCVSVPKYPDNTCYVLLVETKGLKRSTSSAKGLTLTHFSTSTGLNNCQNKHFSVLSIDRWCVDQRKLLHNIKFTLFSFFCLPLELQKTLFSINFMFSCIVGGNFHSFTARPLSLERSDEEKYFSPILHWKEKLTSCFLLVVFWESDGIFSHLFIFLIKRRWKKRKNVFWKKEISHVLT